MFNDQIKKKFIDTQTFVKKVPLLLPFFKQISVIRKYFSMSQFQLAKRAGLTQPILANIENGKQNISINYLKKIANALNCDLHITLTPKKPLDELKDDQIKRVAKTILTSTLNNASLEGHYFSKKIKKEQLDVIKNEITKNPKGIWDAF